MGCRAVPGGHRRLVVPLELESAAVLTARSPGHQIMINDHAPGPLSSAVAAIHAGREPPSGCSARSEARMWTTAKTNARTGAIIDPARRRGTTRSAPVMHIRMSCWTGLQASGPGAAFRSAAAMPISASASLRL